MDSGMRAPMAVRSLARQHASVVRLSRVYFTDHPKLREKTRHGYRELADRLLVWAAKHSITSADELDRAKLASFHTALVNQKKHTAARGKDKRGKVKATPQYRKPVSVNRDLRSTRTILGYLVGLNRFSRLSLTDLQIALKNLKGEHVRKDILRTPELQKLLEACVKHDAATFVLTRDEKDGLGTAGTTPRYEPCCPFVATLLLTGMRVGEATKLSWQQVDLDANEIHLRGEDTKTHHPRAIDLSVSPALHKILSKLRKKSDTGSAFQKSEDEVASLLKRLKKNPFNAPRFSWNALRRTCGTYLTCAPGIFGAASVYRSAKQLGHSVTVAEKHYLDLVKNIPMEAKTLEAAMGIEAVLTQVLEAIPTQAKLRLVAAA